MLTHRTLVRRTCAIRQTHHVTKYNSTRLWRSRQWRKEKRLRVCRRLRSQESHQIEPEFSLAGHCLFIVETARTTGDSTDAFGFPIPIHTTAHPMTIC